MRVFLDVTPWDCRAHNTDWRYVREYLPQLTKWQPELDLYIQTSPRVTLRANWKVVKMGIGKRFGYPVGVREWESDLLDYSELRDSRSDMVFSHRGFPVNADDYPVIWQSSILDPSMTESYCRFLGKKYQDEEDDIREEYFSRAAVVQVSTKAEALRLSRTFPSLAGRFIPIPFFLPYLTAIPETDCERHRAPKTVELLFVGNDALRKGLDLLLNAYGNLRHSVRQRTHLTIISNFDKQKLKIPKLNSITVRTGVKRSDVLASMRKSHILVNLARFESYGFVFPEAMSQGVACIGPDWEVQRELFGDGEAGLNLPCDEDVLADQLERLIGDESFRHGIARSGHALFQRKLCPEVVAGQYAEMFQGIKRSETISPRHR